MMEIKHYKCTFIALNVNFPSGANSLRAEFLGSELDRVNLIKGRFVYDSFFIPLLHLWTGRFLSPSMTYLSH